jgi:hypothetical protein
VEHLAVAAVTVVPVAASMFTSMIPQAYFKKAGAGTLDLYVLLRSLVEWPLAVCASL